MLGIIKRNERVMSCLRRGQPTEDAWELYEQETLQRESGSEGGENEESERIDSMPTSDI